MRDPYVFTHAGRRWALLGAGLDDGRPAVLLYSCDNLEAWDFEQIWLTPDEPTVLAIPRADIWECPQLVTLGQEAVLVVSLQLDGAFGPVLGVRGVLETSPNGQPALTTTGAVERLDLGEDFYAPQVVPDEGDDQRPLLFGWVRQEGVDDGSSEVAGCLTFPRRLGIEDGRLVSVLDPAVDRLAARAAEAAGGADVVTGPARVGLARAVRVVPSGAAVVLHGRAAAISLEAGGSAWVDGEVLEVFPADAGTPTTLRDHGTSSWQVEVPEGGRVRIEQLAQPTP